jgi:hypothetical protein
MVRRGAAALVGIALLSAAGTARAYCRAKVCDTIPAYDDIWQTVPDPECTRDDFGCQLEGPPLFWPATCISFTVQKDGSVSDGIDFELAGSVIERAFVTWQEADCSGAPPSLVVKNLGAVSCAKREYNATQPNANIFMFRDREWPHKNALTTIAFTTLSYNTETGEIYNADVEVNSFQHELTVSDEPGTVATDLLAVMTHEVGHFLGLSHTRERTATMWWDYTTGQTEQRTLEADDVDGICEIYPPGRKVGTSCEPRHGFSRTCATAEEGCSVTRERAGGAGTFGASFVGVFVWLARRAARGGLSSKPPAPRRSAPPRE